MCLFDLFVLRSIVIQNDLLLLPSPDFNKKTETTNEELGINFSSVS